MLLTLQQTESYTNTKTKKTFPIEQVQFGDVIHSVNKVTDIDEAKKQLTCAETLNLIIKRGEEMM